MVVDSSVKYAKEITKETDPKGPYAINTCFNYLTKQANSIFACTEITLILTEKH